VYDGGPDCTQTVQRRGILDLRGHPLRGVMPSGLALNGSRLYVTEAGINEVAVIDTVSRRVIEHRPVGWNPSAAVISKGGRLLYVVNTKGKGTGPNAGRNFDPKLHGSYIGDLELGSVSVLNVHESARGESETNRVVQVNEADIQASRPLPRVQHVFFITRENRTFDEVLGDAKGVNGDARLARYGMHGWAEENPNLKNLQVTPNAHALVAQFATSDNYFVDSEVSADGHRWAVGIAPTPWMNIAWTSHYGGRRHENAFSSAPGRRALFGGSDAPMPEDEPEYGSLWEHVAGSGLKLLNYGEGLELEGSDEMEGSAAEGQRLLLNSPVPLLVFEATDRNYPTFNLGIPDQLRFVEFKTDFIRRLQNGDAPALTVIRLPNDHTAKPRPADGFPYRASYVADNGVALGETIDFLSHQSIWKNSVILVIEDDAQGGVDHVDAHRSTLLVISPYVHPGYVSHRHLSTGSVQKTISELLGVGLLNLEDALAGDFSDMFTSTPHTAPFLARNADRRIFDPMRARIARPTTKVEAAALLDCDDPSQIRKELDDKK
jgi:YVTN family beta-propeller protein